ncbi:Histone-lysine N-methyltransferase [Bertholletia excelsa]
MAFSPQTFNCNNSSGSSSNKKVEEQVPVEKQEAIIHDNHRRVHHNQQQQQQQEEETERGTPIRYVPLCDLYSATSPCVSGSSGVIMSTKKVKARKLLVLDRHCHDHHFGNEERVGRHDDNKIPSHLNPKAPPPPPLPPPSDLKKPPIFQFYSRRRLKRPRNSCHSQNLNQDSSFFDTLVSRFSSLSKNPSGLAEIKEEHEDVERAADGDDDCVEKLIRKKKQKKRGKFGNSELLNLGVDSSILRQLDGPRLRGSRSNSHNPSNNKVNRRRKRDPPGNCKKLSDSQIVNSAAKRWVRLSFDGVDASKFVGLQCKVYWPLDDDWYAGRVLGYNADTNRHHVLYEDGEEENIIFSNERIKFHISCDEMRQLNLTYSVKSSDPDGLDFSEMVVLAASFDDCHELGPGDIIWAKLTGHAMWPAVVVDESLLVSRKGLNRNLGGKSVPVQFFGSHDFARVSTKQIISFLRGLLSSFHLKCKKPHFAQGLEEAKMYLSEQKLPKRMLRMQNGIEADCERASQQDDESADSDKDCIGEGISRKLEDLRTFPFETGDLQVISLGRIVKDSEYFQDGRFIWPEGYTAVRKFPSLTDPSKFASYKMEVLRDVDSRIRPLFRVTLDNGEQFKGSTPSACWNKIYKRIRKAKYKSDGFIAEGDMERTFEPGSKMFGFSNPEVLRLIQQLSNSKHPSKSSFSKLTSQRLHDLPIGYRPVHVKWKDLDKCNVCHMDEEYENNLFLQCDKCRMMVHAKCYGELEPVDGVLWLCNLCRPGAPDVPPPCCLCPVIGGAMKPTSDGRWAHLACAMWIPETCLSDVKKMEPIDGLSRINKDRWKLLCSICGVSYGACIQCSNNTCRVAYHPLCARAAGYCVELEDEDRLHLITMDDDEDEQCIRLLSFCKKHRPPSSERLKIDERIVPIARQHSSYNPPSNPSGCARSEPYNYFGRRGRKEPEALAAASSKRLFVENRPFLVGGTANMRS